MPIHLLPQIRFSADGPETWQGRKWRSVHLAQGSLDGACGPYSVIMALLLLGKQRFDEVTSYGFLFDRTQSKGKLWHMLEQGSAFLRDGTDLNDLHRLLQRSFGQELYSHPVVDTPEALIHFTVEHLREGRPVLLGLRYTGRGGHWLVIVGHEENEPGRVSKLLALDSSANAPSLCAWNAFVDVETPAKHKRYRYQWVNASGSTAVALEDALAIGTP